MISTAGDATLSVADPSSNAPGHLVNGAFSLPSALKAGDQLGRHGRRRVGRRHAADAADLRRPGLQRRRSTITFKQTIGANDALRTGAYSKTLTFTLSTTTP